MVERVLAKHGVRVRFPTSAQKQREKHRVFVDCVFVAGGESRKAEPVYKRATIGARLVGEPGEEALRFFESKRRKKS